MSFNGAPGEGVLPVVEETLDVCDWWTTGPGLFGDRSCGEIGEGKFLGEEGELLLGDGDLEGSD